MQFFFFKILLNVSKIKQERLGQPRTANTTGKSQEQKIRKHLHTPSKTLNKPFYSDHLTNAYNMPDPINNM